MSDDTETPALAEPVAPGDAAPTDPPAETVGEAGVEPAGADPTPAEDKPEAAADEPVEPEADKSTRPESPEAYVLETPEGLDVPAGLVLQVDKLLDDPLVQFWRKTCFDLGLSQAQFSEGIAAAAALELEAHKRFIAEMAKLGENADKRVALVRGFLVTNLGEDAAAEVSHSLVSAATVSAVEKWMETLKFQPPESLASGKGVKTPEELRSLMADPRYQSDRAYREMVTAEYRRTYGKASHPGSVRR